MSRAAHLAVAASVLGAMACAASGRHESPPTAVDSPDASVPPAPPPPAAKVSTFTAACAAPSLGRPVLRLLTRAELDQTLADIFPSLAGQWTDTLPADQLSSLGFENDSSNSVAGQFAGSLLATALSVATALTGPAFASILPCATASPDRTCATQFLTQYGPRLFRRPLTPAEQATYLSFFDASLAKSSFTYAMKWMAVGLIQSPNAVYRSEIGSLDQDGTRSLTPYELATELSYTYTGSTPTQDLLTAAASGTIGDPVAEATKLLATAAGQKTLDHFFEDYLEYPNVVAIQKPNIPQTPSAPGFATVSADMVQETHDLIDQVVFQQGGGLQDLLTAATTNPSKNLAAYYGFPAPATDFASIPRPVGQGIGILAQGSFLAVYADATSSSPTLRGLFPYAHLLCHDEPTPPNTVPSLDGTAEAGLITTRQRFEEQHATGYCSSCHQQWDPMGFGFEHFDEGGRYRQTENGLTIDPSGWVPDITQPITSDGGVSYAPVFTFADEEGFVKGLAQLPVVYSCFAGYLSTYAFGTTDTCLGTSKVADMQSGAIGIAQAFAELAAEPHFVKRASP